MPHLEGEYYDTVRDAVVVIEWVPERGSYMTYDRHARDQEVDYPSEQMLQRHVDEGRLVEQTGGSGRIPDSRGEGRVSGSDVPEDFRF